MTKPPADWYKRIWSLEIEDLSWTESTVRQVVRSPLKRATGSADKKPLSLSPDPLCPTMPRWLFSVNAMDAGGLPS